MQAEAVLKTDNILGEGPLWHPIHRMLYWVDIEKMEVHGFEPHTGRHRIWNAGARVGTVAAAENGNLLLGLQGEIAELDPLSEKLTSIVKLESDLPQNRCNDGKCDPFGRFWVGTMHLETQPGTGSLYCLDTDLTIHKVLGGLTIANGMGWSPKGDHMYFIDSATHAVNQYKFSVTRVALEDEKVILRFENENELPDGMCVDSEGMVWIGFWGGYRVGRYDPRTGKHLDDVHVPAPQVTSCCFGGTDLQTLYITTARQGLSAQQLERYPLSGALFSCQPRAKGMDAAFFGHKA